MVDDGNPQVADAEEASSRLNEGLKTCRAMVANYRAMLSDEAAGTATGSSSGYYTAEHDNGGERDAF